MKYIRIIGIYLIAGLLVCLGGFRQPDESSYWELEPSPLDQGRTFEQERNYIEAEQQYRQIDNLIVRDMALTRLSTAWDSVNANMIRSQEAVNQQPQSAQARLRLAQDCYNKGLLCLRYTRGVVGQYPRDFVRGEQEYFFTQALGQAQKAIQLQADFPEAYLLISEIYLANFRRDEALQELKRLIGKHPEFAKGYYAIGKVYLDMQAYDRVERYFIRAIKLDPMLYDAYYLLGKFYLEKGWFDYAAYTFLEILKHKPDDSPTLDLLVESCHELGKYYLEQEQYDQAIRLFREILQVKSSYEVHQSLVLARQKREEARAKELAAAEEPESTFEQPADVNTFKNLLFADQPLDSLLFNVTVKDHPKLSEAIKRFKEKKFEEGYNILQSAPEKTQTDPLGRLALAFAQQQLGRGEEARQTLRQITTDPQIDSMLQLWAWTALRNLGEQLDPEIANRVLGVIIEVQLPEKNGIDTLAAYSDGKTHYINYSGRIISWGRADGEIPGLSKNVVRTAQTIAQEVPVESRRLPIKENNVRVSLLTCGGVRVSEDSALRVSQKTSIISSVFVVGTDLLESLQASQSQG